MNSLSTVADIYLGEFMRIFSHYAFSETVARHQDTHDTEWQPGFLFDGEKWQRQGYFDPGNNRHWRRLYFSGS